MLEADELVGQPGDRVGLTAAGGVLDQVALPHSVGGNIGEQLADDVELVVAGPDLGGALAPGPLVADLDDLGVVLEDVGQPVAGQDLLPQVLGLEPFGVGRVAGSVVPATVEGQEPRRPPGEVGAELGLLVVEGEVDDAAPELKQLLARVAVAAVLLDRIVDGLLGEVVLQLEGRDRQPVDEQGQVEGQLRLVAAVPQLAGDAEAVGGVSLDGCGIVGRGRAVEEVDVQRTVLDPVAQDVDRPALGDLALQAREEAAACRPVLVQG